MDPREDLLRLNEAVQKALEEDPERDPFETVEVLQVAVELQRKHVRAWRSIKRKNRLLAVAAVLILMFFTVVDFEITVLALAGFYGWIMFRCGRQDHINQQWLAKHEKSVADLDEDLRIKSLEGGS